MEDAYKEVYFNKYCETCKFKDTKEEDEPCDECLTYPVNTHSHKPINYEKKETAMK